jgi:hypothetical protein
VAKEGPLVLLSRRFEWSHVVSREDGRTLLQLDNTDKIVLLDLEESERENAESVKVLVDYLNRDKLNTVVVFASIPPSSQKNTCVYEIVDKKINEIETLYQWQQHVSAIIETTIDDDERRVHWYYFPETLNGRSYCLQRMKEIHNGDSIIVEIPPNNQKLDVFGFTQANDRVVLLLDLNNCLRAGVMQVPLEFKTILEYFNTYPFDTIIIFSYNKPPVGTKCTLYEVLDKKVK